MPGSTFADAESQQKHKLMEEIRKAERKFAMNTGPRFSEKGQHLVTVTFLPSTQFWVQDCDEAGKVKGTARPLTKEFYMKTHGLQID